MVYWSASGFGVSTSLTLRSEGAYEDGSVYAGLHYMGSAYFDVFFQLNGAHVGNRFG